MDFIDDVVRDVEERENKDNPIEVVDGRDLDSILDPKEDESWEHKSETNDSVALIGVVEHFFDKINVAAIKLNRSLRVGDCIEIDNGGERINHKIFSMQIDRKNVEFASAGDSIGIKLDMKVVAGSRVYIVD